MVANISCLFYYSNHAPINTRLLTIYFKLNYIKFNLVKLDQYAVTPLKSNLILKKIQNNIILIFKKY